MFVYDAPIPSEKNNSLLVPSATEIHSSACLLKAIPNVPAVAFQNAAVKVSDKTPHALQLCESDSM